MNKESLQVCNAYAMREALEAVMKVGYPHNFQRDAYHIRTYCEDITVAIKKCREAMSAPQRNCDRFATAKEAMNAWLALDDKRYGAVDPFKWLFSNISESDDANRRAEKDEKEGIDDAQL